MLSFPAQLNELQKERVKSGMVNNYSGVTNAGRLLVMDGGAHMKNLSPSVPRMHSFWKPENWAMRMSQNFRIAADLCRHYRQGDLFQHRTRSHGTSPQLV